ncbi:MAG: gamma-glutamylcyclotransferase [Alphaproteobacteria bacterium]
MPDLWIFGYGSLMWRPGFSHIDVQPGYLAGLHRTFCVYSWVHRGTQASPGLVLGLDRGGACRGVAFQIDAGKQAETIAYLREREQVTNVYLEQNRQVRLADGRSVSAITYVVDRSHAQYAGRLDLDAQLALVSKASGQSGENRDYILRTAEHLAELGIKDSHLSWLAAQLRQGDPEHST